MGRSLADAMGLGKTIMTIALVFANPRGRSEDRDTVMESPEASRRGSQKNTQSWLKGGTLIVCPMALLGQWTDELETHSQPGSISVFVHYGGDRTNDLRDIAKYDVVLTTYGDSDRASIFHKIDWYRVVLYEAHTIKSSKAQVSRSALALTPHCRWCFTGTRIQVAGFALFR